MSDTLPEPPTRVLGRYTLKESGPLVVTIGGMHGNEPAGVYASRRVLETLERRRLPLRGEWLALAGNLPALGENRRFVDEDLNRIWLTGRIQDRAAGVGRRDTVESRQQDEILSEIESALARGTGLAYFVDLHTTSAPGAPFSVFADTLHNRRLARQLPGVMVLGLEEHLEGTLLNYVNFLGYVGVGFEAGQHGLPESVHVHEMAIWKTLLFAGCLGPEHAPEAATLGSGAGEPNGHRPHVVEIRHRHGVKPSDEFVMEPGFENMLPIRRGQLMARDRHGPIRAPYGGRVLMPLYQSQGSDGFFIVRDRSPLWLHLSTLLRRLQVGRLLVWLPGVRRHPTLDDALTVRWPLGGRLAVNVFHLLGYRKRGVEAGAIVMRWRRESPRR